jgi:hypothetical protein
LDRAATGMKEFSMTYKFRLQQIVRIVNVPKSESRFAGGREYEIVRLMPADATGEISYRIKSGLTERAVREFEIKA